jgi:hypothetical protein
MGMAIAGLRNGKKDASHVQMRQRFTPPANLTAQSLNVLAEIKWLVGGARLPSRKCGVAGQVAARCCPNRADRQWIDGAAPATH